MLPLFMNGQLIQSARQLRQHFGIEDMLRNRLSFAQTALCCIRPLSDQDRCASLLFAFTVLRMQGKLLSLDVSSVGPSKDHAFDAKAFEQLHQTVFADENPADALCDAFIAAAGQLLDDGAAIIDWSMSVLNQLTPSCAQAALSAALSDEEKCDLFFLLAAGCLIADRSELPACSAEALTAALRNLLPEEMQTAPAFEKLPEGQVMTLRQREAPYLLPAVTALPPGAVLRPLCIQSAPHARGSTQYQTVVQLKLSPESNVRQEYILALNRCVWLTGVYVQGKVVAVVPAGRMAHGVGFAVDIIDHPMQGKLLLRPDGTLDYTQYKNTAHRLFIQEVRDERFAEMLVQKGELLLLTDGGNVLSSTGYDYPGAPFLSLSCVKKENAL